MVTRFSVLFDQFVAPVKSYPLTIRFHFKPLDKDGNIQSDVPYVSNREAAKQLDGKESLIFGLLSGACSTILFQPFDLLKTRLQSPPADLHINRSLYAMGVHVVRNEGVLSLWKGTLPSLLRVVPGIGLYFYFVQLLSTTARMSTAMPFGFRYVYIGFMARALTGMLFLPLTVLKTHAESAYLHNWSLRNIVRVLITKGRFNALYAGMLPTLIRDAPYAGLYLFLYRTQLSSAQLWFEDPSFWVHFGCGLSSGFAACLITQPFDMVRTQMQLFPNVHTSMRTTFKATVRQGGWPLLLTGFLPRVIKKSLTSACSWTIFDLLSAHASRPAL
ncbi:solute carrier family 25 8 [Trichuris trichiura]|uniref:Solute carrier family 25 8 n=1 Tax=Trichuris trichiura TaxID=36087 RepID=A0A077ZH24_TRITR|nr:solute carrier family 25 8 [Trichuris trichiura]